MSQGANVRSVDAIKEFKVALITFAEDARNALSSADMEVRRVRDWVQRDQLTYWQGQVKRRSEQVAMARTELYRRKLSQANSDAVSDTEQKENLRIAVRKLEEAEDKVQRIKRWVPILEHAINEYHSCSQPLGDRLTGSFLNSIQVVERMIGALDAYMNLAPPPAPVLAPEPGSAAVGSSAPAGARGAGPASAPETEGAADPEPEPDPEGPSPEPGPRPEGALP